MAAIKILSWRTVALKRCHAHQDSNFTGDFFIYLINFINLSTALVIQRFSTLFNYFHKNTFLTYFFICWVNFLLHPWFTWSI